MANKQHPEAFPGHPERLIQHHIKLLQLSESDGVVASNIRDKFEYVVFISLQLILYFI